MRVYRFHSPKKKTTASPSDWRTLHRLHPKTPSAPAQEIPPPSSAPPLGWWADTFPLIPSPSEQRGHPCGHKEMITIVAYDITCPKRLAKAARLCEDYGVRVQYSVFECRLPTDTFEEFWAQLQEIIDHSSDRLIAYRVCHSCARHILTAGTQETTPATPIAYVF